MTLSISSTEPEEAPHGTNTIAQDPATPISRATLRLVQAPYIISTELELQCNIDKIMSSIQEGNKEKEQYYKLKKALILGFIKGFHYSNDYGFAEDISRIYSKLFPGNFDSKLDLIWAHYCIPNFSSKFIRIDVLEELDPEMDSEKFCRQVDFCVL